MVTKKNIFICGTLLLSQMACSESGSISAVHVHYNQEMDKALLMKMHNAGCELAQQQAIAYGTPMPETKIYGDPDLIGRSVKDVYWSRDGGYKVSYEMGYKLNSKGLTACQLRVVPEITAVYENFLKRTKHTYKRTYLDDNQSGKPAQWSALDALKSGKPIGVDDGDVDKESWSVKKMAGNNHAQRMVAILAPIIGAVPITGKDWVAGFPCKLSYVSKVAEAGMQNYSCGWEPGDGNLPDTIVLKSHLTVAQGLALTSVADHVDPNAKVSLSLLLPSAEWRDKPAGGYLKSEKTKGEWLDSKQQQELRDARAAEWKNLPKEEKKRRRMKLGHTDD